MISAKTGIRAEEVRFKAQHVLFVEGKDKEAIDPTVLNELLDNNIKIEPLGPSFSVRSVAEALFSYHPTYYFLIDRDHYDENFIASCWDNFPDPTTNNLLVWRRREIENYFLDPAYLFRSKYCQVGQDRLTSTVLQCANERLYLDAANHVVTSIREELKRTWINKFTNPGEFSDENAAIQKLKNANEFDQHRNDVDLKVSAKEVELRFHNFLNTMTGGAQQLALETGEWIDMIQGKKVFSQVIHSGCFNVKTVDGTDLSGREKLNEVVKDLLQKDANVQPADFIKLKNLINTRISETN